MAKPWSAATRRKFEATMKRKKLEKKATTADKVYEAKVKSFKVALDENQQKQELYEAHSIFAHGFLRGWLEAQASSIGLPAQDFAGRVAELLLAGTGRGAHRAKHKVPKM
jgi:hypothetical protein